MTTGAVTDTRGLWKRAKGYGRMKQSHVKWLWWKAEEDLRIRRRDSQGWRGRVEPIELYSVLLKILRKPSQL
jgi:hypothetical protein